MYYFYGAEEFEKEEVLKVLTEAVVAPAYRTFNLDVFLAEEMDVSNAINQAMTFPMVAPRRMVVIKRIERLAEGAATALLPLIQSPPDTTVLVITAEKPDARKKLFLELRKAATAVEFRVPYDREIPDWIAQRVGAAGRRIEAEAAHLLQMSVGSHLRELSNEIDKLMISTGDREVITRDDVVWVVGNTRGATIFELADAIGRRQVGGAMQILKRMLEQGENPVGMVAMLIRHITILRKASWLMGQRLPRAQMAAQLKVPPFFLNGYLEQARGFDDGALWEAYEALLEADNRLKSRARTPYIVLSNLVYRICRAR